MFVLFPFKVSSFSSAAPTIRNCNFRPNKRKILVLTCGRENDIFSLELTGSSVVRAARVTAGLPGWAERG